ncbi:hypothetical protein KFK09_011674 [Dendrobium nobile]|uniref:Uncharacterized protein n=1 Tax=Dendrobium nobile TaxID=94219 RepID=A0A8T3BDJ0_DENNO|nr:hypothetical protein KFK09_011674 [Dendrobium nobile]
MVFSMRKMKCLLRGGKQECNACANWIARWGCGLESIADLASNLSSPLKDILRLDKIGLHYIKF